MNTAGQANVPNPWLSVGLGVFMAATLIGCGSGGGSDAESTSRDSATPVPPTTAETPITEHDSSSTPTSTAVAAHRAPADFSFSNYRDYPISWNDLEKTSLSPGRNYVLRVAETGGEVYLLAGMTYDQLAVTRVSVPLTVSSLTLEVFDAMTGNITLTREILL